MQTVTGKRTELEHATAGLLEPLRAHGIHVKMFAGDQAATVQDREDLKRAFGGQFPAVLVGSQPSRIKCLSVSRVLFRRTISIELYVASASLRGPLARTQGNPGAGADPGVYAVIDAVHYLLAGQSPRVDGAGALMPEDGAASEEVFTEEPGLVVWLLRYTVDVDMRRTDEPSEALTEILGKLNLPDNPSADPIVQVSTTVAPLEA